MCIFIAVAMVFAPTIVGLAQDSAAIFYAPFDGQLDAAMAGGGAQAAATGQPRFTEGRVGRAVVIGNDSWLSYPLPGNMNPGQGAMEFWLKPIDWSGDNNSDSHFWIGAAGDDRIYIYKFARWRHFTVHIATDDAENYLSIKDVPITRWKPGSWHHAVVNWDTALVRVYIDGQLKAEASIPSPVDDLGDTIYVGKDLATPQFAAGRTAIDELRIYPRPLFSEEVRRAYRRADNPKVTRQPYHDLSIYYTGFPSEGRAKMSFIATEVVPDSGSATLTVRNPNTGATPIKRRLPTTDTRRLGDIELNTSPLTPANYDVVVRITDADGNAVLEQTRKLWIRDKFWERAPQGIPSQVPEPWTPVEVSGPIVRTWNRVHRIGKGRIRSMRTDGEQILSRPAGFHAAAGGATVKPAADWTQVKKTPLQVTYKSELALGKTRIPQRLTIEFDGFMRLDATVPAGTSLDTLQLQMPVRKQFAEYRTTSTAREKFYDSGSFAPGEWPADEVYNFWMGTENLGLDVMLEGCRGWPTEGDNTQLQLTAADGEAVFTAHIARERTTLQQPLELSFGIQATPVRPMADGWRSDWRLAPRVGLNPDPENAAEFGANYAVIWWSDEPDTPRWFGFPQPHDPQAFQRLVDNFHDRGIKVLVYNNLTSASPNTPEAIEYCGEWFREPRPAALRRAGDEPPPERWLRVDQKHPDWGDFIVGWQARAIEKYGVDGWYFDCAQPYPMQDGLHPVFAYRDLCRRAYVALKNRKPDGRIITHMSAHYIAPALAFSDAMLPGEQFRWPLPQWEVVNDYTEVLSLDYARTELTGKNLGCVPVFLPEFGGRSGGERNRRNSWHLLAMTRLHDMNVWPIHTHRRPLRRMWQAQDRFGIGQPDVSFLLYWDTPPAEVADDNIRVSAYTRPGRALLVISNFLGGDNRTVTVRPKLQQLDLRSPLAARDLLTRETIPVNAGRFNIDIPEGRARYVILRQQ